MTSSDTIESIINMHNFQVNSCGKYNVCYFIINDKNTTHLFLTCRYPEDLHKPRVKMQGGKQRFIHAHI